MTAGPEDAPLSLSYSLYSNYSNYSLYRKKTRLQQKSWAEPWCFQSFFVSLPHHITKTTRNMATPPVLLPQVNWENLHFYQKTDTLYQMTVVFCERFLPPYGDRTVDQMVQAARSGKQNIVEGFADGKTSTEMQLKLLNVARASIQELREDYRDYLNAKHLQLWTKESPRFQKMVHFCSRNNKYGAYQPFFDKWSAEEMANTGLTLCHMTDTMMNSFLKHLETEFVTKGGIKERMYAARTGYRQQQDRHLAELEAENRRLKALLQAHGIKY